MRPGCGVPGAVVEIRVDGMAAAQAPWNATALTLNIDVAAGDEPAADALRAVTRGVSSRR
jgi:hypothetical protein